jgi:SAM-dependent methyltransferase
METDFYRAFEDRHRGSRDEVKRRLGAYMPFLEPLKALHPEGPALDLGCGRGEWLEVLGELGIRARGVDTDEGMLAACRDAGFEATATDANAALKEAADASVAIVSGIHIAEHIPFPDLQELVRQALRVLKPGGLLILETPNPENIVVGTAGFYLDPTHQRPLPPGLLAFLPEHFGFHRTKVLRLQEAPWLNAQTATSVLSVLRDVSADYAVVAQKAGTEGSLAGFDNVFEVEVGLTLEAVATYYDRNVAARAQMAELLAGQARAEAEQALARAEQAEAAARQAETAARQASDAAAQAQANAQDARANVQALVTSKSWRLTAPLRAAATVIRNFRGK